MKCKSRAGRFIIVAVISLAVFRLPAMASVAPFQIALWNTHQLVSQDSDIWGVRLDLVYGENRDIRGVDLGVVNVAWREVRGLQIGVVNSTVSLKGVQCGLLNLDSEEADGVQVGAFNCNQGVMSGIQFGVANIVGNVTPFQGKQPASSSSVRVELTGIQIGGMNFVYPEGFLSGVQVGAINVADRMEGLQVGIINCAMEMNGVQIGLLNFIPKGPMPFMPIVNAQF